MKSIVIVLSSLLLMCIIGLITCPPVTERPSTPKPDDQEKKDEEAEATNLEYDRYLREVVSVLESDQAFKKKLEESNISDIKSGEIAKHLDFVSHGIRTQLDEIKRREIDRLRQVMRLKSHLQNGLKRKSPDVVLSPLDKDRLMGHLDHNNPDSFEVDDLAKLIRKATSDLEEVDKKRREEFKKYEMEKEHLRKQELEKLDSKHREEAEKKFKDQEKKHGDHPKLHHPGNEAQLKEVWEESDGLNEKDFDPRTFFNLHDTNGDGVLDEAEVEALFQNELDKAYDPNAPEDDMMERYEEMNRMREHVMNEVDKNKDKLITLEEFIENTKSQEFKKDEEWETLDHEQVYSDEDFKEFERLYAERERQKNLQAGQDHLSVGEHQQQPGAAGVKVMPQHMQQQQQHIQQQQQQNVQQQQQQHVQQQQQQQHVQQQHHGQQKLPNTVDQNEQQAEQPHFQEQPIVVQPAVEQPAVAQPAFEQPSLVEQPVIAESAVVQSVDIQPGLVGQPVVVANSGVDQPVARQPQAVSHE